MKPKITVALTSINELHWLKRSIPAWKQQNYPNFEIVIVDDMSNDGTEEFIKSNYPEISYTKLGDIRHGYGVTKNACVAASNGEYILLLDNDVLPNSESYLSDLFETYKSCKDVAFLGVALYDSGNSMTKYYGIYYSLYGTKIHKKAVSTTDVAKYSGPIQVPSYHGGGVFFKKEIWNELGGYDTTQPFMLDDTDISARAYAAGYKVYLHTAELLEHIGISNHDDKQYFAWKFTYYLSGALTVMLKNFPAKELFRLILAGIVYPFIYASVAFKKKNPLILKAYFASIGVFIKNLPHILKQRKMIQAKNRLKDSAFLYIKEPF